MVPSEADRALDALVFGARPDGARAYLLLDASADDSIPFLLPSFRETALCLFGDSAEESVRDAAPWLVALEPGGALWSWFARSGWGQSWGVLIHSPAEPDALKRRLKALLPVMLEAGVAGPGTPGGRYFFKFYLPQHLRTFLPAFEPPDQARFMSGVTAWIAEGEAPGTAVRFALDEAGALATETLRLGGEGS